MFEAHSRNEEETQTVYYVCIRSTRVERCVFRMRKLNNFILLLFWPEIEAKACFRHKGICKSAAGGSACVCVCWLGSGEDRFGKRTRNKKRFS